MRLTKRRRGWETDYPLFTTVNRIVTGRNPPVDITKFMEVGGCDCWLAGWLAGSLARDQESRAACRMRRISVARCMQHQADGARAAPACAYAFGAWGARMRALHAYARARMPHALIPAASWRRAPQVGTLPAATGTVEADENGLPLRRRTPPVLLTN